jgi:dihydrofolate reductase
LRAERWPGSGRSSRPPGWINGAHKYVVSDTLTEADVTSWTPTTIIRGAGLLQEVPRLRDRPGGDIYVYGSVSVVRTLLTAGLIDELVLMTEPITLGGGKTLFPNDGETRDSSSPQPRPQAPAYRSAATSAPASCSRGQLLGGRAARARSARRSAALFPAARTPAST